MSALSDAARDYLRLRNSLGHELAEYHRELPRFVAVLDAAGLPTVTVAGAVLGAGSRRRPGQQRRAAADDDRPRLRPLHGRHRRSHRSATTRVDLRPTPLASTVHL